MAWQAGSERSGRSERDLVSLILLVALVVVVVMYRRRGSGLVDVGTMVRRFLEYGFLYGLVLATAIGATGALGRLSTSPFSNSGDPGEPEGLALWFSLLIVAGGALAGLALWLRRRFRADSSEADATGWSLYRSAVDLTAVGFVVAGSTRALGWLLDGWEVDRWILAAVPVWAVVGLLHGRLPGRLPVATHLVGATVALIGISVSGAVILEHLLEWAYDGTTPEPIRGLGFTDGRTWADALDGVAGAAAPALAFGGAWVRYWWLNGRTAVRSPERDGYVLVVGVLGGLAATVVAGSGVLHTVLSWVLVASSRNAGAVAHFDVLTVYGALLGVGLLLWAYHRREVPHAVVRQAAGRDEVSRLYDHLEAGVGLVASTVGVALLLGIVLHKVMPAPDDWDRDVVEILAVALTALLVGGPVWARAWWRIQLHAGEIAEESSAVRRIHLFSVFSVTALCVLGSLGAMVFLVLFGLLDGSLDVEKVAIFRFPLALLGATVGVAAYHGRVLRTGLRAVPVSSRPTLRTVTLVGVGQGSLGGALREIPGVRLIVRRRLDVVEHAVIDVHAVVEAVRANGGDALVLVDEDGTWRVVPLAD
jgi:hypothetical protein